MFTTGPQGGDAGAPPTVPGAGLRVEPSPATSALDPCYRYPPSFCVWSYLSPQSPYQVPPYSVPQSPIPISGTTIQCTSVHNPRVRYHHTVYLSTQSPYQVPPYSHTSVHNPHIRYHHTVISQYPIPASGRTARSYLSPCITYHRMVIPQYSLVPTTRLYLSLTMADPIAQGSHFSAVLFYLVTARAMDLLVQ